MVSSANRVLTVALAWIVIVFGCYFFNLARPELETGWEQLSPLPERATSIELTRFGYVYAYTQSGSRYMANLYSWQDETWTLYNSAIEEAYGTPCEVNVSRRYLPPSPPGEPISRSNADCFASAESNFYTEVVLLENNEVWLWSYLYGGIGEAFTSILVIAAAALGAVLLLIGLVMKINEA